jgi:tyrosinase
MNKPSRRQFLAGSAALPFGLWMQQRLSASGQYGKSSTSIVTRYEARTPEGKAMLRKYATAVQLMKKTNVQSPTSWDFQWYTHGTPTQKMALINATYPGGKPVDWCKLAINMWSTCQPHYAPSVEDYFSPWHRMYVYYFEDIVRSFSGDANFALPYWDYTKNAVLPDEFRMPNDPVFGSLYNAKRGTGINAGNPINSTAKFTDQMNQALCQPGYSPGANGDGYNQTMDWNLHGNVHDSVGGQMSNISEAANDPIFWMHHSNVDRLWASWNNNGGQNPGSSSWLSQTFTFADRNGHAVTAAFKDFLDLNALGYKFDQLVSTPSGCRSREEHTALTAALASPQAATDRTARAVTLGSTPVRVALQPTAVAGAAPMAERAKAGGNMYLVLRNMQSDAPAGTTYDVFLNLPSNVPPAKGEDYNIGMINFFDLVGHGEHKAVEGKYYRFDITKVVQMLSAKGGLKEGLEVAIAPTRQPDAKAKPVIGEISVIRS